MVAGGFGAEIRRRHDRACDAPEARRAGPPGKAPQAERSGPGLVALGHGACRGRVCAVARCSGAFLSVLPRTWHSEPGAPSGSTRAHHGRSRPAARIVSSRFFRPAINRPGTSRTGLVVVDDEDRENEGDLTMAAQWVTPEAINFMATHGRGLICLALAPERCDAL